MCFLCEFILCLVFKKKIYLECKIINFFKYLLYFSFKDDYD